MSTRYGFYSAAAVKAGTGSCFYEDENGNEVEITCVCDSITGGNYRWADKKYVGIVTKFLRKGKESQRMREHPLGLDGREFYPEETSQPFKEYPHDP